MEDSVKKINKVLSVLLTACLASNVIVLATLTAIFALIKVRGNYKLINPFAVADIR